MRFRSAQKKIGLTFAAITAALLASIAIMHFMGQRHNLVVQERSRITEASAKLQVFTQSTGHLQRIAQEFALLALNSSVGNNFESLKEVFFDTSDTIEATVKGLELFCANQPCAEATTRLKQSTSTLVKLIEAESDISVSKDISRAKISQHLQSINAAEKEVTKAAGDLKTAFESSSEEKRATYEKLSTIQSQIVYLNAILTVAILIVSFFLIKNSILSPLIRSNQNLGDLVEVLKMSADEVRDVSTKLERVVTSQNSSVTQSVAAITQIQNVVRRTESNLKETDTLAQLVREQASAGKKAFEDIHLSVEELAHSKTNLRSLERVMSEIAQRAKAINGIVLKTQVLSLNASIEASRAGVHGKGFSVVAMEVGRLAEQSGAASEDINRIIEESRQKVTEVVDGIDKEIEKAESVLAKSQQQVQELLENVESITKEVSDVRCAAQEQATGIEEVVKSMSQLLAASSISSEVAQQSRNIGEKTSSAIQKMATTFAEAKLVLLGGMAASNPKNRTDDKTSANKSVSPQNTDTPLVKTNNVPVAQLSCDDFIKLYQSRRSQGAVLIDIRNDDEVAGGTLPNAKHIPLPQLEARKGELSSTADNFIFCRGGARAQKALEMLQKHGFTNVFIAINGGYEQLSKLYSVTATSPNKERGNTNS